MLLEYIYIVHTQAVDVQISRLKSVGHKFWLYTIVHCGHLHLYIYTCIWRGVWLAESPRLVMREMYGSASILLAMYFIIITLRLTSIVFLSFFSFYLLLLLLLYDNNNIDTRLIRRRKRSPDGDYMYVRRRYGIFTILSSIRIVYNMRVHTTADDPSNFLQRNFCGARAISDFGSRRFIALN
jgi:hypothetical protein